MREWLYPLTSQDLEDINVLITENTEHKAINEHFAQECAEASAALSALAANLLKLSQIERGEDPTDEDAGDMEGYIEHAIDNAKKEIIDVFNYMWVTGYEVDERAARRYRDNKLIRWAERMEKKREGK